MKGFYMNIVQEMWQFAKLAEKEPHDNSDLLVKDSIFTPMSNSLDYGYIADFKDRVIIAFRGTRGLFNDKGMFDPDSWISDLTFFDVKETNIGTLHEGFWNGWKEFENPIVDYIKNNVPIDKPIIYEGYSRGSTLATLGAIHCAHPNILNRPCSNINFGSPKVGKSDFRDIYEKLPIHTTRCVNGHDIVPELPLWDQGFRHVGNLVHFKEATEHQFFHIFRDHAEYDQAVNKWDIDRN
jgi:predicted lipase